MERNLETKPRVGPFRCTHFDECSKCTLPLPQYVIYEESLFSVFFGEKNFSVSFKNMKF